MKCKDATDWIRHWSTAEVKEQGCPEKTWWYNVIRRLKNVCCKNVQVWNTEIEKNFEEN